MLKRFNPANYDIAWEQVLDTAIIVTIAIGVAWLVHKLLFALLHRLSRASQTPLDEMVFDKLDSPMRWAMVAIGISAASQIDPLLARVWDVAGKFVVPAVLGWVAYVLVKAFTYTLEYKAEISDDPIAARSRKTRIAILSRTITFAIIFVTIGLMLLGIPVVREIGVTLVASAGLAALAVGAAAQPALEVANRRAADGNYRAVAAGRSGGGRWAYGPGRGNPYEFRRGPHLGRACGDRADQPVSRSEF